MLHVSTSCHPQGACNQYLAKLHKYAKCSNFESYYQQLPLKYLCNLPRYWLQAPWGWHDSVATCRSVIICEVIVHFLVVVQNRTKNTLKKTLYKSRNSLGDRIQSNVLGQIIKPPAAPWRWEPSQFMRRWKNFHIVARLSVRRRFYSLTFYIEPASNKNWRNMSTSNHGTTPSCTSNIQVWAA